MPRRCRSKPLDGVSLVAALAGHADADWPDRMIFSHWNGKVSVRTQQYRLDAAGRLYDMVRDPGQTRDMAARPARDRRPTFRGRRSLEERGLARI